MTGDKGLAGAFNANITKAAARFLESKAGKNVDIEAIGRKGRDFLRRRYPAAKVQTRSLAELSESIDEESEDRRTRRQRFRSLASTSAFSARWSSRRRELSPRT